MAVLQAAVTEVSSRVATVVRLKVATEVSSKVAMVARLKVVQVDMEDSSREAMDSSNRADTAHLLRVVLPGKAATVVSSKVGMVRLLRRDIRCGLQEPEPSVA